MQCVFLQVLPIRIDKAVGQHCWNKPWALITIVLMGKYFLLKLSESSYHKTEDKSVPTVDEPQTPTLRHTDSGPQECA